MDSNRTSACIDTFHNTVLTVDQDHLGSVLGDCKIRYLLVVIQWPTIHHISRVHGMEIVRYLIASDIQGGPFHLVVVQDVIFRIIDVYTIMKIPITGIVEKEIVRRTLAHDPIWKIVGTGVVEYPVPLGIEKIDTIQVIRDVAVRDETPIGIFDFYTCETGCIIIIELKFVVTTEIDGYIGDPNIITGNIDDIYNGVSVFEGPPVLVPDDGAIVTALPDYPGGFC